MQYTQRKLQRSVTEMRRSRSARPRESATKPVGATRGAARTLMTFASASGMTRALVLLPGIGALNPLVNPSETKMLADSSVVYDRQAIRSVPSQFHAALAVSRLRDHAARRAR